MPLHPLVSGFAEVADDYEYGRPCYLPEAVAAAARGLRLAPGARIADVGAGTGKLTRALAAAGFDVVAVEPLPGLRERLRAAVPGVEALAGTAEALPLPDAAVDAVACADAFHWFDGPPAVAEFARVIRPGGGLALLWNMEDDEAETPPWHVELGDLLERVRPEHPSWTDGHEQGRGAVAASPAFGALALDEIRHERATDRDRLIALVGSMSFVGGLPRPERLQVLERVAALLDRHGVHDVRMSARTTVWTARRTDAPSSAMTR